MNLQNLPSPHEVLDVPMDIDTNDPGACSIREYLAMLAEAMWAEASPKRPFGNSGWHHEVYEALVRAGHVEGTFDEDDCLDEFDRRRAEVLVIRAVRALGGSCSCC